MSEEIETKEDTEKGIQVLIYLESLRGKEKTHRAAEIEWYMMEELEKEQAMMAYGMMKH